MDFGLRSEQELYRQELRQQLADEPIKAAIAGVRADPCREPDVRPLYRELGRRGLLAPNWPPEYGGGGRDLMDTAIAAEEMYLAGVPDTLYINTIHIVGQFIEMVGSPEQKARHLPPLARGERFASVLYTEPDSGSDLGSLSTVAVRDGDWRLHGVKVFNMKSQFTDLGLCAARTGPPGSGYRGISLFLVDLHAPGVRRSAIEGMADEWFHRIELNGVRVAAEDLLGQENDGWLLSQSLAVERTGLDYSLRAEGWLTAACEVLAAASADGEDVDDVLLEEVGRHSAAVTASRLLVWQVLTGLAEDRIDEAASAVSKLYCGELAQRIGQWSAARLTPAYGGRPLPVAAARELEAAYREAPGTTISGGTSEMMLQIIASLALDGLEQEARAW